MRGHQANINKRLNMKVETWTKDQSSDQQQSKENRQMTLQETMRRYRENRGLALEKSRKDRNDNASRDKPQEDVDTLKIPEGITIDTPGIKEKKKKERREERWSWLVDKRDSQGNKPEDVGFDPRTLQIPHEALASMTVFQRQYWNIKKHNMDLVLFVRVGSFYELYDTDADVGLRVGLKLVGGVEHANFWKCGCRASSFHLWANKCLSLGYSVGRVEEIRSLGGDDRDLRPVMNVVERRLVQSYTPGTCTMTCWDDLSTHDEDDVYEEGHSRIFAMYEHKGSGMIGGCLINTINASIEVAEWQEVDEGRRILVGILEESNPLEIVVGPRKFLSLDTRQAIATFRPLVSKGVECRCTISLLRTGDDVAAASLCGWRDVRDEVATFVGDLGGSQVYFEETIDSLFSGNDVALRALLVALYHMKSTGCGYGILQRAVLEKMAQFSGAPLHGSMSLHATSLRHLEIHTGSLGTKQGSLYEFLSLKTSTGMGRRCVSRWLSHPLTRLADIEGRLDVVDALKKSDTKVLREALRSLPDLEKMMPSVAHQISLLNLEDQHESLMMLSTGIQHNAYPAKERVVHWGQIKTFCTVIHHLLFFVDVLLDFMPLLEELKLENLPMFRKFRQSAMDSKSILLPISGSVPLPSTDLGKDDPVLLPRGIWNAVDDRMVAYQRCQDELNMHVGHLVSIIGECWDGPARAVRNIRLTGVGEGVGLTCPKTLHDHILGRLGWQPSERTRNGFLYKEDNLVQLSKAAEEANKAYNLSVKQAFSVLASVFLDEYGTLLNFCQNIGELDALLSFALVTQGIGRKMQFKRPRFSKTTSSSPILQFKEVWNPQLLSSDHKLIDLSRSLSIVTNSVSLGGKGPSTVLLTGANSGGKTTLLKTIAISTIMAQIGCYVPCSESLIDPVNRIMTRLGARDRIQAGESTFAIEMKETSAILHQVDRHSLTIIDELGRGTAPIEGEAIAWATLKALAQRRCRTLFATHFHGLNDDFELSKDLIARYHMGSPRGNESCDDTFKLLPGPAPSGSMGGITCARNAGVPEDVIQRAYQISRYLHRNSCRYTKIEGELLDHSFGVIGSLVSNIYQRKDELKHLQARITNFLHESDHQPSTFQCFV